MSFNMTVSVSVATLALVSFSPVAPAQVHVDASATGLGDGNDFPNAFKDLQAGLNAAAALPSPIIVYIAKGTYTPTAQTDPLDPRSVTFLLQNGVTIAGGYIGGNTTPANPGVGAFDGSPAATILSGNIGDLSQARDNAYSVVTSSSVGALSGMFQSINNLQIRNGFAGNPQGPNNSTVSGAGLYADGSNVLLSGVIFDSNSALDEGGAIYHSGTSASVGMYGIDLCTFSNNTAGTRGGALFLLEAVQLSGANNQFPAPYVYNCVFDGNRAGFASTDFANIGGGAVWIDGLVGGGVPGSMNDVFVVNNEFLNNTARGHGSAISVRRAQSLGFAFLGNNTVAANHLTATEPGKTGEAVFFGVGLAGSSVSNSIIYGNTGPVNPSTIGGPDIGTPQAPSVTYSDVERLNLGGGVSTWPGPGNINALPQFMSAALGDLRLRNNSPCIDVGLDLIVADDLPDLDLDGNRIGFTVPFELDVTRARIVDVPGVPGTQVDMGAHESTGDLQ